VSGCGLLDVCREEGRVPGLYSGASLMEGADFRSLSYAGESWCCEGNACNAVYAHIALPPQIITITVAVRTFRRLELHHR